MQTASLLSTAAAGLEPSATLAIRFRCREMVEAGRDVVEWGLGQSPFPIPAPVVAALREHAAEKAYLPSAGLPALRAAVAAYHTRRGDLEARAQDVIVAPGSKELMFLLQLVLDAELVLPSPSWVSYAPQAKMLGRPVHWLETRPEDGWRLQPDVLDAFARSHRTGRPLLLVLNYPNNPTGMTLSDDAQAALAEVARRHGMLVLSDEIYGELDYTGGHVSIARHYPEGTIVTAGLSKWCGAGGWRLGTAVFPPALEAVREALAAAGSETYSCAAAPVQHAAVRAYEGGPEIDRYLHDGRRICAAVGRRVAATLREAGLRVDDPDGGFYLFPDASPHAERLRARGLTTSPALCERLLADTGVAVLPGSAFGRPPEEPSFRLAFVAFDGIAALKAAGAVPEGEALPADVVERCCGRDLEAARRVAEWMAG